MHVLLGALGLAAVLALTLQAGHGTSQVTAWHGPAAFLVGVGPLCIVVMSYRFEELWRALQTVWEAARFNGDRSRADLYQDLTRFAAEVRQRRPARALEVADASHHALLRQLGPLLVRQYPAEEIERTGATALYALVSGRKRREDVFAALGKVAPAAGLVGTVLGLITLLRDLRQLDQLGPSMALALLCTLYGLLLANGLYQPLARLIHNQTALLTEEARLLVRGLMLTAEGRPLADVRRLFEGQAPVSATPEPEADVALGGGG